MPSDLLIRGGHGRAPRRRRRSRPTWRSSGETIDAIGPDLHGRARGARRPRAARAPRRDRRPRALQRARPHRLGGLGHRHPRARRGRGDGVHRDAAQRPPADDRRRRLRRQGRRRERVRARRLRALGRARPRRLDRLEELAERGVVGFKAFMCDSGIEDFPAADADTLGDGMRRAAQLGLPVAVHAESPARLKPPRARLARLRGLPTRRGRARGDRAGARARARDRLRAARRPRLLRRGSGADRQRARGSTPRARPARTTSRSPRTTSRRSARAPSAPRRCVRPASATALWAPPGGRPDRVRRLRPLALPADDEGGRVHRGVGRHRRLPVAAAARARAAPARRPRRSSRRPTSPRASSSPRPASSRAPTPTSC